jgi:hypothetical protein
MTEPIRFEIVINLARRKAYVIRTPPPPPEDIPSYSMRYHTTSYGACRY